MTKLTHDIFRRLLLASALGDPACARQLRGRGYLTRWLRATSSGAPTTTATARVQEGRTTRGATAISRDGTRVSRRRRWLSARRRRPRVLSAYRRDSRPATRALDRNGATTADRRVRLRRRPSYPRTRGYGAYARAAQTATATDSTPAATTRAIASASTRSAQALSRGDHDYNDRYGSRDYKREYRAFEQGYRGYGTSTQFDYRDSVSIANSPTDSPDSQNASMCVYFTISPRPVLTGVG